MKSLKTTYEYRAYTEEEAKSAVIKFHEGSKQEGYTVGSAGYVRKEKKKKGEVVSEAWIVKCVAIYDTIWDEDE